MWAPSYFKSEWCVKECYTMLFREAKLGYRTLKNPGGLVIPVNVSDGKSFPDFGDKAIHYFDCRKYIVDGDGFKKTEKYVEFQEKIEEWVKEVAVVIENVPPWNEEWLKLPDLKMPEMPAIKFDHVP